jgi:hypothetical protein
MKSFINESCLIVFGIVIILLLSNIINKLYTPKNDFDILIIIGIFSWILYVITRKEDN